MSQAVSTSQISQFISRVLEKRMAQKPKLEKAQACMRDLSTTVQSLLALSGSTANNSAASDELKQKAELLNTGLKDFSSRFSEIDAKAANLMARFSKGTINIGVAGRARQGKSTILQAISGLNDTVIPTSSGLPCTGAKSVIHHCSDAPHAMVEFYREDEFLREIVHAYYDELVESGNLVRPGSMQEFSRQALPEKGPWQLPGKIALYEKLRHLQTTLPMYQSLLSRTPQKISLAEVRDFVSQEEGRKKYLAVRCANIFSPFPNNDVVGLALIDLPGLGEIALGHSEKLVASLQREVDAVVLVKMPSLHGDHWTDSDMKVFTEVKKAVPELDIADWLFVILNRTEDNANATIIEQLKNNHPNIGSKPTLLDVVCKDPQAVRENVLKAVLRHLECNLERIDKVQWEALSGAVMKLIHDLEQLVLPVGDLLKKNSLGSDDRQEFRKSSRNFWKQLTNKLHEQVMNYSRAAKTGGSSINLGPAVDEACDTAKKSAPIPTPKDLEADCKEKAGWNSIIQDQLHILRAHLTQTLATILDKHLASLVLQAKADIINGILSEPVGNIISLDHGAIDKRGPTEKLDAFRALLDEKKMPNIISGIDFLRAFSFSYQSHFHHRVREAMSQLNPMGERDPGVQDPVDVIKPEDGRPESAGEVANGLRIMYERVIHEVRKSLQNEMDKNPGKILFSLVEEVNDRLTRAKEVQDQWDDLLYPLRNDIWPSVYGKIQIASKQRKAWLTAIEGVNHTKGLLVASLA